METHLTIKHLAPYLPYGLKVFYKNNKLIVYTLQTLSDDNCGIYNYSILTESCNSSFRNIKPILRPLSDLTKEIEVNGVKFVPIVELVRQCHSCGNDYPLEFKQVKDKVFTIFKSTDTEINWTIGFNYMPHLQFHYVQKLFEWHFDVFGLIEQGLAIDINTLNAI